MDEPIATTTTQAAHPWQGPGTLYQQPPPPGPYDGYWLAFWVVLLYGGWAVALWREGRKRRAAGLPLFDDEPDEYENGRVTLP